MKTMPVNDFEKKVQQKMDELQLRPSPEVWTEVEKRIRKDKRRRVIFFWLPLAALFLGGIATVWIIMSGSNTSDPDKTNSIAGQHPVPVTNKNNENTNTTIDQPNTNTNNQQQATTTGTDNNSPVSPTAPASPNNNETAVKQQPAITTSPVNSGATNRVVNKPRLQQDNDAVISVQQANTRQQKSKTETGKPIVKQEETDLAPTVTIIQPEVKQQTKPSTEISKPEETVEVKKPGETNDINKQETVTIATQQQKADSNNNVVVTDKKEETTVTTPETAANTPRVDKISRKKWQFSIELQTGGSDIVEGGLFNTEKSLVYANPSQNGIGATPGAAFGPFAPPILVSSPSAGFSAGIKLEAERPLSRRLSVQGAIGYTYLSTTIEVGSRINVPYQIMNDISRGLIVESFYGSSPAYGSTTDYTNRFHLLGISAGLSWKFINKKKLTISWDNSISVNKLLSTNALLFDRMLRGYYKDFDAYRKTQFIFTTGFTVPVWRHNRFSVALHPFAAYGISPVLKANSGTGSHFLQYGLGLKFSLLQKK
jgi:hypothetical protein